MPGDLEDMHGSIPVFAIPPRHVQIDGLRRVPGFTAERLLNRHPKLADANFCAGSFLLRHGVLDRYPVRASGFGMRN